MALDTILFAVRVLLIVVGIFFGILLLIFKDRMVHLKKSQLKKNYSLQILFKILIYVIVIASFMASLTLALSIFGII